MKFRNLEKIWENNKWWHMYIMNWQKQLNGLTYSKSWSNLWHIGPSWTSQMDTNKKLVWILGHGVLLYLSTWYIRTSRRLWTESTGVIRPQSMYAQGKQAWKIADIHWNMVEHGEMHRKWNTNHEVLSNINIWSWNCAPCEWYEEVHKDQDLEIYLKCLPNLKENTTTNHIYLVSSGQLHVHPLSRQVSFLDSFWDMFSIGKQDGPMFQ